MTSMMYNNHSCCTAGQCSFSCALSDNIKTDVLRVVSLFCISYLSIIGRNYKLQSKVYAI